MNALYPFCVLLSYVWSRWLFIKMCLDWLISIYLNFKKNKKYGIILIKKKDGNMVAIRFTDL